MFGRYVVKRPLAVGAQASLYRAFDRISGQDCVLKAGVSVQREAFLALELNHPFIVKPFDFAEHPDLGPVAAYPELLQPSLLGWTQQKPSRKEFQRVALQIAEFMCFLHRRGWLYNDFKPDHFLVGEDSIAVIDLGLCSSLEDARGSATYSGTFPYISPERLAGRIPVARSDVFAAGMMLLHSFFPNESWDDEPSLSALQRFQKRSGNLNGMWRRLISAMTALEPGQRIGSAHELWKKLRPSSAKKIFLFFPCPAIFSLADELTQKDRVIFLNSASRLNLEDMERQILQLSWKEGRPVLFVDLAQHTIPEVIRQFTEVILNSDMESGVYSAIDQLLNCSTYEPVTVVFRNSEDLETQEKGLLFFVLSSLTSGSGFRFFVLSSRPEKSLLQEGWRHVEIPAVGRQNFEASAHLMFPETGKQEPQLGLLLRKNYSFPEHVLYELTTALPVHGNGVVPAAVHLVRQTRTLEDIRAAEKRALSVLAIAGGILPVASLISGFLKNVTDPHESLLRLCSDGFTQMKGDHIQLICSGNAILGRLRKMEIRRLAAQVLDVVSAERNLIPVYFAAHYCGERRKAAACAIWLARNEAATGQKSEAISWWWNAFENGAELPRTVLYAMAWSFVRKAEIIRTKKILNHLRSRFHLSFRLIDCCLDLYHRCHKLDVALNCANIAIRKAKRDKNRSKTDYFQVRKAGFLILKNEFSSAEEILKDVLERPQATNAARGLAHHNLGHSFFQRGLIAESLFEYKKALPFNYRTRSTTVMNVGTVYLQMGKFMVAEKWVLRAIVLFQKQEDVERLSLAYNNLGLVKKNLGELNPARECYFRSIQLARLCRNRKNHIAFLLNVALTYGLEGRTGRAISFFRRAEMAARKAKLPFLVAMACNNLGLQYSIQGKFGEGIRCLTESERIREKLGLRTHLAFTYEYKGLAYLFSKRFSRAEQYLNRAAHLFAESNCVLDQSRCELYLALRYAEGASPDRAKSILKQEVQFLPVSFERGLFHYVWALTEMTSKTEDLRSCRDSLHEAERLFRKLPALFWLGRLYLLKAKYYESTGHLEKASISLQSATNLFSSLGAQKELLLLQKWGDTMKISSDFQDRMAEKLPYRVLMMIKEALSTGDPEEMISKILSATLDFTDMERAVLILTEDPPRIFRSTTIDDSSVQEIVEISQSAMQAVTETGKSFLCLEALSHPFVKSKPSILSNHIMSIICLPLRGPDGILGILYLDSKEGVEALASTENAMLEIFAAIIALSLNRAVALEKSLEENRFLRNSLDLRKEFPEITGKSEAIKGILKAVQRLRDNDLPVLITGETGTGKELIARVLHFSGAKKNGPFVAVNCSAFSKDLLESELFGHEKGAFTGAIAQKKGLFEEANHGTLFLDEISETPLSMQAKLLRVLQGGEFRRVGGSQTLRSDARIVLATNRDLAKMVESRDFREDLYYRIQGVRIQVPPLRERREDIPLLAAEFLKDALTTSHRKIRGITSETLDLMKRYSWPGNVRQLKLEIDRIVALTENDWIHPDDLDPHIKNKSKKVSSLGGDHPESLSQIEKQLILDRLNEHGWNVIRTARSLGLSRHGLYSKMQRYCIRSQKEI